MTDPLEQEILTVIEERKKLLTKLRVRKHDVNWNEHQTRYTLIDPILRVLGWDISDPMQVKIEASNSSRDKPDYLLYTKRRSLPKVVVEAKRVTLGDIRDTFLYEGVEEPKWMEWAPKDVAQAEKYWKNDRPRFAALTNGIFWAIYDLPPNARGKLPNKLINYSNILRQDPRDYMKALKLLRRSNVRKLG